MSSCLSIVLFTLQDIAKLAVVSRSHGRACERETTVSLAMSCRVRSTTEKHEDIHETRREDRAHATKPSLEQYKWLRGVMMSVA